MVDRDVLRSDFLRSGLLCGREGSALESPKAGIAALGEYWEREDTDIMTERV